MSKKREKAKVNRKKKKAEVEENSKMTKVISTIVAFAFALFVGITLFLNTGVIGGIIKNIIIGAFGTLGYLFPFIIIIAILINLLGKSKASINVKIYSLLIFYIAVICLFESSIQDFNIENNGLYGAIEASIKRSKMVLSIENFSGGVIGTSFSYITFKAMGKAGSICLYSAITLITFILMFGLGISKIILKVLKAIVMFIPNLIKKNKEQREEDRQIEIDNTNILNATIDKSRNVNMGIDVDNPYEKTNRTLDALQPEPKKKYFDTSHVKITTSDVTSKFFNAGDLPEPSEEEKRNKEHLLNEIKKKSLNEVKYENPEIKPNEFFYTEKMKPISELEHISIPEPRVAFETNNYDNNIYENRDDSQVYINEDEKNFASGLNDLKDTNDTLDYQNMSNHDILLNDKKDIELVNPSERSYKEIANRGNREQEVISTNNNDIPTVRKKKKPRKYRYPQLQFLKRTEKRANSNDPQLAEKANILIETLKQFGVGAEITNITVGPSVTRFELKPELGVKVSKILALEDDVKLALAATEIRIEAPIPGKSAIGIEIPNRESTGVTLGDIISTPEFRNSESKLTIAIGKDIQGRPIVTDLKKTLHLLIAGATGSGKSVCINSLITSLIYKSSPEDVRLIMVDPKMVELQVYDGIPHLLIPVVTDAKKAASALNWAVNEMTRRYNLIQEKRVRDIDSYNQAIAGEINKLTINDDNEAAAEVVKKLPYIVIIIDEFADLMMVASKEVENAVQRIAQLARACGIYLVIATQKPTVNVISGNIKANVPSRIAFAVSSGIDSQIILDRRGAEKLLGHGDMLYFPQGIPEPKRLQGCYVSENEILDVVDYVKDDPSAVYDEEAELMIEKGSSGDSGSSYDPNEKDDLFIEAGRLVIDQQNASIGMLQRRFRIGFNRAARIIDQLEANNVVSRQDGKKSREVLMDIEEFKQKFGG